MKLYKLFSKSPFDPLKELLAKVDVCVDHMKPLLEANFAGEYEVVKEHFRSITIAEHEADVIKNSIRDHLPRSILLPIDRWHFLEILSGADKIADWVEDLAYILTVRETKIPNSLHDGLEQLADKALECYKHLTRTVALFDDLLDSGFTGPVADHVIKGIDEVCHLEWETDKLGYKFSQTLFEHENKLSAIDLIMIRDIAKLICGFADSVEALAKHIRRTLAR